MTNQSNTAAQPAVDMKVTGFFSRAVNANKLDAAAKEAKRATGGGSAEITITLPRETLGELLFGARQITASKAKDLSAEDLQAATKIETTVTKGLIFTKEVAGGSVGDDGRERINANTSGAPKSAMESHVRPFVHRPVEPALEEHAAPAQNIVQHFFTDKKPEVPANISGLFADKSMANLLNHLIESHISQLKQDSGISATQVKQTRGVLMEFAADIAAIDNVAFTSKNEEAYFAVLGSVFEKRSAEASQSYGSASTYAEHVDTLSGEENSTFSELRAFIPPFFNMIAANDKPSFNPAGRGGLATGMEAVTFDYDGVGVRSDYAALRRLQQHVRFMASMAGIDAEVQRRDDYNASTGALSFDLAA